MISSASTQSTRSFVVAGLLLAAVAFGSACGSEGVAYDRLYLSVTSDAPSGGATLDNLRALLSASDGAGGVILFPDAVTDPDFNLNLATTGLDPVTTPVIVQIQYSKQRFAASSGVVTLQVTGRAGTTPVAVWEGQVDLNAKTLFDVHLVALEAASDCDADKDGFLDCSVAGCCPNGGTALADCADADASANPWQQEAACEPCGDTVDNDCRGGDQPCVDADQDGVEDCREVAESCGVDNANQAPGMAERCDDVDNNCVGGVDEGFVLNYGGQQLAKGASCGTGACAGGRVVCASLDALACDTDANRADSETCGDDVDNDCDGDTDEGCSVDDLDGDGHSPPDDCNDHDSGIYSGAPEPCCQKSLQGDAAAVAACDKNCDGVPTWCEDGDADGDGYTVAEGDCNDSDPLTYPDAPERCGDGVDQDCLAGDVACAGLTDADGDGWPAGVDCRDDDKDIHPGVAETCDGVDNDCSGAIDDGNPGGGGTCGSAVGACELGVEVCVNSAGDAGTISCIGDVRPVDETCDGVDNDCDTDIDEDFTWQELAINASCDGTGACGLGTVECVPGRTDAATCSTNPDGSDREDALELCDQLDNDCDGTVNEDLHNVNDSTCKMVGVCGANLASIVATCDPLGAWQCDYAAVPGYEANVEASCDGKDNDCDGATDDEFAIGTGCDGDDVDSCANGVVRCAAGDPTTTTCDESQAQTQVEVCDGADNDCDGLTDEDFKPGANNTVSLTGASYPTDNGKKLGEACGTGVCTNSNPGTVSCDPANPSRLICYTLVQPSTDFCDDKDNDCNGVTDDIYLPAGTVKFNGGPYTGDANKGKGQTCGTGSCAGGAVVCATTSTLTCSTLSNVSTDVCDDGDNNCNGATDEGFPNLDGDAQADCVDPDDDNDGVIDANDACKLGDTGWTSTAATDHDGDGCRDAGTEDLDDDNDGKPDTSDTCGKGDLNWTSNVATTDHDNDGCRDDGEDTDDDNDGVLDDPDGCERGVTGWTSNATTDYDGDGCKDDQTEDPDDDNDSVADLFPDLCPKGVKGWTSNATTDYDGDGCKDDQSEDLDDDNDGVADLFPDLCPKGVKAWTSTAATDHDGDGCKDDQTEDLDDDNDSVADLFPDLCPKGVKGWTSAPANDYDGDGCKDDQTEDLDDDNDGVADLFPDLCPKGVKAWTSNATTDYDGDGCKDDQTEDLDDDNDGVADLFPDACPKGVKAWTSNATTDYDGDGCKDDTVEDLDDDNDSVADLFPDLCPKGVKGWTSTPANDYDGDGCRDDQIEDLDDDNDGVADLFPDLCPKGVTAWTSNATTDYDGDGCKDDQTEDLDDDNDGVADLFPDACPKGVKAWTSNTTTDYDGDGCKDDQTEDLDDDNDGVADLFPDLCPKGVKAWTSAPANDYDGDGCKDDTNEDLDDDNDSVADLFPDACPKGVKGWTSTTLTDYDGDGCKDDQTEDLDDDNDGVADLFPDRCPKGVKGWTSAPANDYDGDGCKDDTNEDLDDDNDSVADLFPDLCPKGVKGWTSTTLTDYDGDGCKDDQTEDLDDDNDSVADLFPDACPKGVKGWTSTALTDYDGDGCKDDQTEDPDDDNDGVADLLPDLCPKGVKGWTSAPANDYDGDGCKDDQLEDLDDDNDSVADLFPDLCPKGVKGWTSNASTDHDGDGCKDDNAEDPDDDNDSILDGPDACELGATGWTSTADTDYDGDGCKDDTDEDLDDDNDGVVDLHPDLCPKGLTGWVSIPANDYDGDGCLDAELEDGDDDNDGVLDGVDGCPKGDLDWVSVQATTDHDSDGCRDDGEDDDDDNDGKLDLGDGCPRGDLGWISSQATTDHDNDGCRDDGEDTDDDGDGKADGADDCPRGDVSWTSGPTTDNDSDGCRDDGAEDPNDDNDSKLDAADTCPRGDVGWTSNGTTDFDDDGCKDATEDTDDDSDGALDADDSDDRDPNVCRDTDHDNCDDCALTGADLSGGSTSNDGTDTDADGLCDAGDTCTDADGDGWGRAGLPQTSCGLTGNDCDDVSGNASDNDHDNICVGTGGGTCTGGATAACDDNCPTNANPTQADADADAVGDTCDTCTDADADGWGRTGLAQTGCAKTGSDCDDTAANANDLDGDNVCINTGGSTCTGGATTGCNDNCPVANPTQVDADGDLTGDVCDLCTDADADGWGRAGLTQTACPNLGDDCDDAATNVNDVDHDNICINAGATACTGGATTGCNDNCPANANATQVDTDGDLTGDACDTCTDADADGWGRTGFPQTGCASSGNDCDDAATNVNDVDHDNICINAGATACTGGVTTGCNDNCPADPNATQADADGDLTGDACDTCTDADADGWGRAGLAQTSCTETGDDCDDTLANVNDIDNDNICINAGATACAGGATTGCNDNCPADANATQADADADAIGDACDTCTDADGDDWGMTGLDQTDCALPGDDCDDTLANANDDDGDNICVSTGGGTCTGGASAGCDDNCLLVINPTQADADADAIGDDCDTCTDGDGDTRGRTGFTSSGCALGGSDCDDTAANVNDVDNDNICIGTGGSTCADLVVTGCNDNCPATANATQADGDNDLVGTACDNCPADANADQANVDGDSEGDVCDLSLDTPGNHCDVARVLALGVTENSTTATALLDDQYGHAGCPDQGTSTANDSLGKDEVWAFTAATTGEYTVTLTPEAGVDLIAYAFSGPTCVSADCFGWINEGAAGVAETLTLGLVAGQTFYLVVDAATGVSGAYGIGVANTTCVPDAAPTDLFISEYIEGGNARKGIEVYNGTGAPVNLANYRIKAGTNGAVLGAGIVLGSGTLANNDVWVVCYDGSGDLAATVGAVCDLNTTDSAMNFNGNDAIALTKLDGTLLDVIGVVGVDPGAGWSVAGTAGATANKTLVRKASVKSGATTWATSAGTTVEDSQWTVYAQDTTIYLGAHTMTLATCPALGAATTTAAIDALSVNVASKTDAPCPDGYVGVGFDGESAWFFDKLWMTCEPIFLGDLFLGMNPQVSTAIGTSTGGTSMTAVACPAGEALVGIMAEHADQDGGNPHFQSAFTSFTGICRTLADIAADAVNADGGMTTTLQAAYGGTAPLTLSDVYCPNGSVVVGMEGYAQTTQGYTSQVALTCRDLP